MNTLAPRMRMFAGPNGSGKTTIKSVIGQALVGMYINPDEIEKNIRENNFLNLNSYGVKTDSDEILKFFRTSEFIRKVGLSDKTDQLRLNNGKLIFHDIEINSYFASVIADFIRKKLLEQKISFSFETVMSSSDKIDILERAQKQGYRTYLYYVATDDPAINISRVRYRVTMGGHPVPEDKIIGRYHRSLDLLVKAIKFTNRAYIFDNSSHEHIWLAEITQGKTLEMKSDKMPLWFKKAVWDKFN